MRNHSGDNILKKLNKDEKKEPDIQQDGSASFLSTGSDLPDTRRSYRRCAKQDGRHRRIFKDLFLTVRRACAFIRKDKHSEALAFAMNNKHKSKREKRRQTLLLSSGAGIVILAVFLVILTLGGQAAPVDASQVSQQELLSTGNGYNDNEGTLKTAGAKMPVLLTFTAAFADEPYRPIAPEPIGTLQVAEDFDLPKPTPTPEPKPTPKPIDIDKLIDYFVVEDGPYYNDKRYSSNYYDYSREEYLALARIIHGEARGESYSGQVAVGNVVMNRVLCRGAFASNIIGVVSTQFSPWSWVKDLPESKINSSCKRAARAILDKQLWVVPQDVYFFKAGSYTEGEAWNGRPFYKKIGRHFFYRYSYSGRKRNAAVPPALYDRTYKYAQYGCKSSNRVYRIQYMLNKLGYDVKADKYFGLTTKEALVEFQKKYKLKADGIAGPATLKRLIKEFGAERYVDKFVK